MSEVWYDREEDVLGIQLSDKKYLKSVEVSENVVVDLSDDWQIIGIEIYNASRSFKHEVPAIISASVGKPKRPKLLVK